jgi:hypothetical protein
MSSLPLSPCPATQTLPERGGAVVLDTDVASRSFKGRLPLALDARVDQDATATRVRSGGG